MRCIASASKPPKLSALVEVTLEVPEMVSKDAESPAVNILPVSSRLRLWPAWLIALTQVVALKLTVTPSIQNTTRFLIMMAGPLITGFLFSVWLLVASRLRWKEKLGIAAASILCPLIAVLISVPEQALHTTQWIYGIPIAIFMITLALTCWRRSPQRTVFAVVLLSVGWGSFTLLRNEGFDGEYYPGFAWRWSPRHEETLSQLSTAPQSLPNVNLTESAENTTQSRDDRRSWPQFRGPEGNGAVAEDLADPDWTKKPPKEIWKIPIGLGWSSFAYNDGRLFTQEQRGEKEYITCYSSLDGSLIWSHSDESRFSEVVSGAGPRSTPSVAGDYIYALGGNGLLTCLTAIDGTLTWQRSLVSDLGAPLPMWRFSGSPLIIGNMLVIYAGAAGDDGLIAVEARTGQKIWGFPSTGMNYTTARLMTLADQACLIFCDGRGVHALTPDTGEPLWSFQPKLWKGPAMVDPQQISPSTLIVALGDGIGMARLEVTKENDKWSVRELWSTTRLRPSFNDSVVLGQFIYGFNQAIFTCIDASTGERKWQGGRYGFGQTVLLKNSARIIVAAENGDVVLLKASAERLNEIARMPVLNDKAWNHPIVVGDRLFLRNGKVAACLQLSL